jgi:threonine dehydrogenase-like Zn-dependent dehydrogenase
MRQAVIFENGKIKTTEQNLPAIGPDEALIRLRLAGVCSTDLELIKGYMGFQGILGHEFVGEVIEGPDEWRGQRVAGEINIACGRCDMCRAGLATQCRNRSTLGISGDYDGAFAEVLHLPVRNLHRVPDSVSDEEAVFTEPLAAACQVLEQVHIPPTETVPVIGVGRLGMLVAQVLHISGIHVIGIIRHEAQAKLLAKWGIESRRFDEMSPAEARFVVDCTGNSSGFADALALVQPRGTIILKSTYEGLPQANLTQAVVDEISIIGSRCGPFEVALRHLAAGRIDVQSLIQREYRLDQAVTALDYAGERGVLKVLLRP